MKRNMLSAAMFLCLGMYVWNNFVAFDICLVIFVIIGYCFWCIRKKRYAAVLVCVLAVVSGFFAIHFSNANALYKAEQFLGKEVNIAGKVMETKETDYGQRICVKHCYTNSRGKAEDIKIYAYLSDKNYEIRYGETISFSGDLKLPDTGSGWGGYNKRMSLRAGGVLLETTGKIKNVSVTATDIDKYNIIDLAHFTKEFVCKRVDKFFSENVSGAIKGIIAGDCDQLSEEVEESFKKSGVSHILVVSGMHINIIIIISMYILMAFGIGRGKAMMIIQLLLVWFFVFMTGFGLSAIRAAIVITVLFLGNFISREADPLNSLGVAAVIMLIINPAVYFSLSFRLSFLSAGAILLFAGDMREKFKVLPGGVGDNVAITLAAQIGVLIPISQSFGNIGVFGILANVLICPVMTPVVAVSLLAIILGDIPLLGAAVIWVAETIMCGVIEVTRIISLIPHSVIDVLSIRGFLVVAYVFICAAAKFWLACNSKMASRCFSAAMVLICTIVSYNVFFDNTHITFLHTGNSDCAILEHSSITIMFDGAGDENYSVSESTIIPYMRKEGIGKIDVAFVTHYHTDHAKGIAELIKAGRIKRVVVPAGVYKKDFEIANEAKKAGIPLHYIGNSDKIKIGDIYIEGYNTFDGREENNGFVYFVSYGESRICITGDVHKNGEKDLILRGINLKSNIIKVAHHGSDSSGDEEFLRKVSPQYAIVLRGDNKFPDAESKKIYSGLGTKLYSTNDCGNIRITLSESGKTKIRFGRNSFYELRNIKKTG